MRVKLPRDRSGLRPVTSADLATSSGNVWAFADDGVPLLVTRYGRPRALLLKVRHDGTIDLPEGFTVVGVDPATPGADVSAVVTVQQDQETTT